LAVQWVDLVVVLLAVRGLPPEARLDLELVLHLQLVQHLVRLGLDAVRGRDSQRQEPWSALRPVQQCSTPLPKKWNKLESESLHASITCMPFETLEVASSPARGC
jgi:hypothetical protein